MFVLRNPVNCDYHCSLLTGVLREADSVTYGVNHKSPLNKLDDFDVCDGHAASTRYGAYLVGRSNSLHNTGHATEFYMRETLTLLIKNFLSFKFSRSESRNKPSQISSHILHNDGNIHQSGNYGLYITSNLWVYSSIYLASQMWNLAVYLPLMIGDLVPEFDKLSFAFGNTTNLCLLSFFNWFSRILESLNWYVPVFVPWMLPTQEYYTKATLYDPFSISNFKVSIHHVASICVTCGLHLG